MTIQSCRNRCWKVGLVGALAIGEAIIFSDHVFAQSKITPDKTLGTESSIVEPDPNSPNIEIIRNGAARGANLFHSFREFNVSKDGGAYFLSPNADIQNILARVTGASPSEILGTLGTFGESNPNLFLMNPNGVIFGPSASLDMGNKGLDVGGSGGSFVATTANAIQLGKTGVFSASEPARSNLLSVNPSALFFNAVAAQEIVNRSTATTSVLGFSTNGLQVPNGRSLLLVGGDVKLQDGGRLNALGGRVELGGLAGAGTVELDVDGNNLDLSFPDRVARADVSLTNGAGVGVAAGGGGSIAVSAQNLDVLGGSSLNAGIGGNLDSVDAQAGDITLNATEAVTVANGFIYNSVGSGAVGNAGDVTVETGRLSLSDGAQLAALTFGKGNTGSVKVRASESVELNGEGPGLTILTAEVSSTGRGNAGDVTIDTKQLNVRNGAQVAASTFGEGDAGNLIIRASESVELSGRGPSFPSGLFADVNSDAKGQGGNLTIETGSLSVADGGQISASTYGQGNAGGVNILANDQIALGGSNGSGYVLNSVNSPEAVGSSKGINITTGSLFVENASQIRSQTLGRGDSGNIKIVARDTVSFDGRDSTDTVPSAVFTSVEPSARGNGGNIYITTGSLSITNRAQLLSNTEGRGNAGNVFVEARDQVSLTNSIIISEVTEGTGVGEGGDINIKTGSLLLKDGSALLADLENRGRAGDIKIEARDHVVVEGEGLSAFSNSNEIVGSQITATVEPQAVGKGGNIDISASSLLIDEGFVSTKTEAGGNAGRINITTGNLSGTNGGQIIANTFGKGNAGNVIINASDKVSFDGEDSQGFVSGAFSTVGENAKGNGGDISITAESLLVTSSAELTTSSKGTGTAGDLKITTDKLNIKDGAGVSADTFGEGNAGNLTIETGSLIGKNAQISASTYEKGNAGNLTVRASESIELSGEYRDQNGEPTGPGGLLAQVDFDGKGQGGNLTVETKRLSISNGSKIQAATFGDGNAGEIKIRASEIDLFNTPDANNTFPTQINAGSTRDVLGRNINSPLKGNGGNLNIETGRLNVRDGAQVSVRADGQGDAGTLRIDANESVEVIGTSADGQSISKLTGAVGSGATGSGGDLSIEAGQLHVQDGAEVTVSSQGSGNAGNLTVSADSIGLDNNATLNSDTTAGQGNIFLRSEDLVLRRGSNITTNAQGTATGGNIKIDTNTLVALEDSDISANAQEASGGQVIINAQGIVRSLDSDITATSDLGPEFSGIVEINTPDTELQGSLNQLSANFVSPEQVVAGSCLARRNVEQGSFVVTGTGGLPRSPYEAISGRYTVTGVQPIQGSGPVSKGARVIETNTWKKGDPIQEAQGMVVTADGRTIVGTTPQLVALAKAKNLVCDSD